MLLNPLGFTYYYLEGFSFHYYIAMQSIIYDNVSIKCYYYVWNNYNLLQYSVGYYTLENQANINKWLLYICFNFVFGVTLTTSRLGSCYVTVYSSLVVQSNARKLNILANGTTSFGVYSVVISAYLVSLSMLIRRWTISTRRDRICIVDRC